MYNQSIIDTQNEVVNLVYPLNRGLFGKKASIGVGVLAYQGGEIEWIKLNPAVQDIQWQFDFLLRQGSKSHGD